MGSRTEQDPVESLRSAVSARGPDVYEAALQTLADVRATPQLYDLVDLLGDVVEERHACMRCDEGCSDCCAQLPVVTFQEWVILHGWILANMPLQERQEVVRRCEELIGDDLTALPRWLALNDVDLESEKGRDYVDGIFSNETTPCPMLVSGRCSVYPVRPLICRSYGRMMRTEDDALYCQRIVDKLKPYQESQGEFYLPIYRPYQEKAYELEGQGSYFTLIPIWVLSHRDKTGDLIGEPVDISRQKEWPVLDTRWGFAEAFGSD